MADTKLQVVIDKQLPEFIREDYDKFVQFLKAYYKYLDIADKRDLEELRDIDKTLYDYITFINNEIGFSTFPNADAANIDPRLFLRKSKQAFASKGTEESFKFLFRILYNKPVQVSYPWDSVLKTSDGKWNQDISIFVKYPLSVSQTQAETNANSYVGNNITINSSSLSITVYVKKVKFIRDRVYEVSIDKRYYGKIEAGSTITQNGVTSTLLNTTTGYEIIAGGKGFSLGDLLVGNTIVTGSQVISQLIKVTKVDNDGAIQKISTISYNGGYDEEFFLLASKQNVQTTSAQLNSTVSEGVTIPKADDSNIDKYSDYGYIIRPDYFPVQDSFLTCAGTISVADGSKIVTGLGTRFNDNSSPATQQVNVGDILQTTTGTVIGTVASIQSATQLTLVANASPARSGIAFRIPVTSYADPGYVGTNLRSFYEDTLNNSSRTNTEDFALIAFKIGAVAKYQGYYVANDGFLSDDIRIQDSKYYQKYSYLLTVNEKLDNYRGYVNSYIHPAGVKGFAEYQIQESYAPVIEVTQSLVAESYNSKATFKQINKDIINEFVSPLGMGGRIKKNPYDSQGYMEPDYNVQDYVNFTEA